MLGGRHSWSGRFGEDNNLSDEELCAGEKIWIKTLSIATNPCYAFVTYSVRHILSLYAWYIEAF